MFAETSPIDKVERRLVARLSDQIVGFVDINENHVRNLFVDPSQQGNKIETQLIRKVEELVIVRLRTLRDTLLGKPSLMKRN